MKKILSILCIVALLLAMQATTLFVGAVEEIPLMAMTAANAGAKIHTYYTETKTPAFFGWYAFPESQIIFTEGSPTGIAEGADWTAANIAQYGATITLPADSVGKYIYAQAGDDEAHGYAKLQGSVIKKIERPLMTLSPDPLVPGESVTANYNQTETPSAYGWWIFEASEINVIDGIAYANDTALWTGIPQYTQTIDLPADSAGKYIVSAAVDATWAIKYQMSAITQIPGEAKMLFEQRPPEEGKPVTVLYTGVKTPAWYGWYLFDEADVLFVDSLPISIKETADFTAANISGTVGYAATATLPADCAGKYLYVKAGDDEANGYATLQESAPTLIYEQLPDIGEMPANRRTWFGFEHVANGVNMGIAGSDLGPTELRRPSGELWNPNAATWASTEWSTFTDLYQLNSVTDAAAPQGSKLGKWINKQGLTVPSGKGEWTSSLISGYLDEPRNTYLVGASEFMFWMDATNYVVPDDADGNERDLAFVPRFSAQAYDEEGNPTGVYGTYMPGTTNACYYNVEGDWVGARVDPYGFFHLPVGYEGYVRIPLEGFVGASWNAAGNPPVMQLNNLIQIVFYFNTYAGEDAMDSYVLFDDLSFGGPDLQEMPVNYYQEELIPEDGIVGPNGVVDEYASVTGIGGTKATVQWDPIAPYATSYSINLYKLENAGDEIGTFVKTISGLTGTSTELTGLDKDTLYSAQVIAYNSTEARIAIYESVAFKTTTADDGGSPETGDAGVMASVLATLLLGAAILFIRKRRTA